MKYFIKMIWEDGIYIDSPRFDMIYDTQEAAQHDIDEIEGRLGFKKYVIIPFKEVNPPVKENENE